MARRNVIEILTVAEAYEKSTLATLRPLAKLLATYTPSTKSELVRLLTATMLNQRAGRNDLRVSVGPPAISRPGSRSLTRRRA